MVAVVRILEQVDRAVRTVEDPDLVPERQIDRSRAETILGPGVDHQAPGLELGQDRVARQHAHSTAMIP